MPSARRYLQCALVLFAALALSGCNLLVLSPHGDIAAQQGRLIIIATVLMLLVIVPVIFLTLLFAWRYRAANTAATYKPDWDHSTQLELVIWAIPLLIIIALGAVTWISTHTLDPFRPLSRIAPGQPVPADVTPLEVEVVALDWKWLFLYPEYNIASVNEIAAPVDRPIRFKITSSTVMNAFYVPALAGMIYAMPGMETQLNAVINRAGEYHGISSSYSGHGFSGMRFGFRALDDDGFQRWIADARRSDGTLDRDRYLELEKPSEREPVSQFSSIAYGLYDAIVNRCVDPNRMCMNEMMMIDANGGLGLIGVDGLLVPSRGDLRGGPFVSAALCEIPQQLQLPWAQDFGVPRS